MRCKPRYQRTTFHNTYLTTIFTSIILSLYTFVITHNRVHVLPRRVGTLEYRTNMIPTAKLVPIATRRQQKRTVRHEHAHATPQTSLLLQRHTRSKTLGCKQRKLVRVDHIDAGTPLASITSTRLTVIQKLVELGARQSLCAQRIHAHQMVVTLLHTRTHQPRQTAVRHAPLLPLEHTTTRIPVQCHAVRLHDRTVPDFIIVHELQQCPHHLSLMLHHLLRRDPHGVSHLRAEHVRVLPKVTLLRETQQEITRLRHQVRLPRLVIHLPIEVRFFTIQPNITVQYIVMFAKILEQIVKQGFRRRVRLIGSRIRNRFSAIVHRLKLVVHQHRLPRAQHVFRHILACFLAESTRIEPHLYSHHLELGLLRNLVRCTDPVHIGLLVSRGQVHFVQHAPH